MEHLQYAVPTLFGLEGLCADEMRRLGLDRVQAENGRVLCQGSGEDLARLNLNLRTGERVLLVLGRFPARSFEELPKNAQNYVLRLEELSGARMSAIGVGPGRDHTIVRHTMA